MIRQDAVFDRPKERGNDAEAEEGKHQYPDGGEGNADDRDRRHEKLAALQKLGQLGLVVLVGEFAGNRRQEQKRHDEDAACERHQGRSLRRHLGENDENQSLLQKIIIEGGKELRPEQRRELPRSHQVLLHGVSLIQPTRRHRVVTQRLSADTTLQRR